MAEDLLTTLGIKIKQNALSAKFCDRIQQEILESFNNDQIILKELKLRKTYKHQLSKDLFDEILEKMEEIRIELETFFDEELKYSKPIQALLYNKGHFFKPHRDDVKSANNSNYRKITTVFFLNEQEHINNNEGEYSGGDLNLYGLFKKYPTRGFTIPNKKGTMVAFRADEIHEVTLIEQGHRCTLVVWFE